MTLKGGMLDDYATVRRYIEGVNRFAREMVDKTSRSFVLPMHFSDTESYGWRSAGPRAQFGKRKVRKPGRRAMLAD